MEHSRKNKDKAKRQACTQQQNMNTYELQNTKSENTTTRKEQTKNRIKHNQQEIPT